MFDNTKNIQRKEFQVEQVTVNNEADRPIVDPDKIIRRWNQYVKKTIHYK